MQSACRRQAHASASVRKTSCIAGSRESYFQSLSSIFAATCSKAERCIWPRQHFCHSDELLSGLRGNFLQSQRCWRQGPKARECWAPRAGQGEGNGSDSAEWKSSDPYKVLNVPEDSDAEAIKAAYRNLMKEYHPDVYSGKGDANVIADRLIRAYKVLIDDEDREEIRLQKERGPFREPVGAAVSVFVNEFQCIGPRCPYSCVRKAPKTFYFADDTKRARATNRGGDDDYTIQMAVGQCPETCIHFVTEDQRLELERLMQSVVLARADPVETQYQLEMLIATANFENGRDRKPKRTVKKRDKYVDWF